MAVRMVGWRTDAPQVGVVLEVWYVNTVLLATWDGAAWRTIDDRRELVNVTHWRKRHAQ